MDVHGAWSRTSTLLLAYRKSQPVKKAVGRAQHPFFSYLHPTPSRHPPTTPPFLTPTPHPVTTPNRKQLYRPDADRLDPAELVVSGEAQVEAQKVHLYAVVRGDGMVLCWWWWWW